MRRWIQKCTRKRETPKRTAVIDNRCSWQPTNASKFSIGQADRHTKQKDSLSVESLSVLRGSSPPPASLSLSEPSRSGTCAGTYLPVVRDRRGAVKVGTRQRAPLDPEGLHGVERRAVQLLEALVVGDEHVPLDDRDHAERAYLGLDGLVQEQLVELHRRPLGVGVLLLQA